MEPQSWLQQYGPMGCALIVICTVLLVMVYRVLPFIAQVHADALARVVDELKEIVSKQNSIVSILTARLDKTDVLAAVRHDEVLSKLNRIDEKVGDAKPGAKA